MISEYCYTNNDYKIIYDYINDFFILELSNNKIPIDKIGHFVSWIISPTSRCNNICDYCFADHYTTGDVPLKVGDFEKIAKDAAKTGLLRCDFSGGEPFLRVDLEDIIMAMAPYIGIVITTAARNLQMDRIKRLSTHLPFLQISLDGHTDTMNAPRNTKVKELISTIIETIGLGIKVRILTVVHKYNYNNLAAFGYFLYKLGVWEWKIINAVPSGKGLGWKGILNELEYEVVKSQLIDIPIDPQLVGFSMRKQRICIILEDDLHLHIDRDGTESDLGKIDLNSPFDSINNLPIEDSIVHLNYYLHTHSNGKIIVK